MPKLWCGAERTAVNGVMRHQRGADSGSHCKKDPIFRATTSTKAPFSPRSRICIMLQAHVHV